MKKKKKNRLAPASVRLKKRERKRNRFRAYGWRGDARWKGKRRKGERRWREKEIFFSLFFQEGTSQSGMRVFFCLVPQYPSSLISSLLLPPLRHVSFSDASLLPLQRSSRPQPVRGVCCCCVCVLTEREHGCSRSNYKRRTSELKEFTVTWSPWKLPFGWVLSATLAFNRRRIQLFCHSSCSIASPHPVEKFVSIQFHLFSGPDRRKSRVPLSQHLRHNKARTTRQRWGITSGCY